MKLRALLVALLIMMVLALASAGPKKKKSVNNAERNAKQAKVAQKKKRQGVHKKHAEKIKKLQDKEL